MQDVIEPSSYLLVIPDRADLTPIKLSTSDNRHAARLTFGFKGTPKLVATRIEQLFDAMAEGNLPHVIQLVQGKKKMLIEGHSVNRLGAFLDGSKSDYVAVQFSFVSPRANISKVMEALNTGGIIDFPALEKLREHYMRIVHMPEKKPSYASLLRSMQSPPLQPALPEADPTTMSYVTRMPLAG